MSSPRWILYRLTLRMALNPKLAVHPFDRTEEYLLAVGKGNGNAAHREHMISTKDTWMILGALAAGIHATLLGYVSIDATAGERSLFDQLTTVFALFGFGSSLLGPVLLGGVIRVNASACGVDNFDLFMLLCHEANLYYEFLVSLFAWSTILCTACLPFVLHTPLSQLPDSVAWLEDWRLSLSITICVVMAASCTIAHINTVCFLSTRAGLFSPIRACDEDEASVSRVGFEHIVT